MRKLLVITYVTLDGVMQSPGAPDEDPRNGFGRGGWMSPYWDGALNERVAANMSQGFDLLLGRRTYEMFAAFWPYAGDNPITNHFNAATKYVVTRTLQSFDWARTKAVRGEICEEVRSLKAESGPELQVHGSSTLLQTLMRERLVDEFQVWTFPLVLGDGKRLFETGVAAMALRLEESVHTPTGVVVSTYRTAGEVKPGSRQTGTPSEAELARRRKLAAEDKAA